MATAKAETRPGGSGPSLDATVRKYENSRAGYERHTEVVKSLIETLLREEGIRAVLESRTKTVESFQAKIGRSDKVYSDPLAEVTDLSAVRIIVQAAGDLDAVGTLLRREFEIDQQRSVRKVEELGDERFGYLSEHYLVRLDSRRSQLAEYRAVAGMWAEIQVRTALQDAWAKLSWLLAYKKEVDIPKGLRRRLNAVAAILELADRELDELVTLGRRIERDAIQAVAGSPEHTAIDISSLGAYIGTSAEVEYWASVMRGAGSAVGGIGAIGRDVEMLTRAGVGTIGLLDQILRRSRGWGEKFLTSFYRNTWGSEVPSGASTDRNGVVTLLLIANYPQTFTDDVLERDFGFGEPWRATRAASATTPTFVGER